MRQKKCKVKKKKKLKKNIFQRINNDLAAYEKLHTIRHVSTIFVYQFSVFRKSEGDNH